MANYTFGANQQGWTLDAGAEWTGAAGNPAGCLYMSNILEGAHISGLSIPVGVGDPVSYDYRVVITSLAGTVTGGLSVGLGPATQFDFTIAPGYSVPYDSGWQHFDGVMADAGTITGLSLGQDSSAGGDVEIYYDNIYVAESPPVGDQFRLLGLASDTAYLYLTAIENAVLYARAYDLANLGLQAEVAAGAAAYGDPDTLTKGIWPVAKPGSEGVLFLRGRDGNDVKIQLSDDGGVTFSEQDDAGWAADKFCVALLPDPLLPGDLVACFADNDLYRSEDSAATWSKTGDSPVTLGEAARHTSTPAELLLAAQAADSLRFTNNYGLSFDDVSDTVGTVRVIEVSR